MIFPSLVQHEERAFVLKFSAMEIYNEVVRDLLGSDSTPLRLLDDPEVSFCFLVLTFNREQMKFSNDFEFCRKGPLLRN